MKVWLIGPESVVYHLFNDCPRLRNPYRYWPIHEGRLQDDGTIVIVGFHGTYRGRRVCQRCHKRKEKNDE